MANACEGGFGDEVEFAGLAGQFDCLRKDGGGIEAAGDRGDRPGLQDFGPILCAPEAQEKVEAVARREGSGALVAEAEG